MCACIYCVCTFRFIFFKNVCSLNVHECMVLCTTFSLTRACSLDSLFIECFNMQVAGGCVGMMVVEDADDGSEVPNFVLAMPEQVSFLFRVSMRSNVWLSFSDTTSAFLSRLASFKGLTCHRTSD
jgi:hypothetical protein